MELLPEIQAHRTPEHPVDASYLNRWSPRAFSSQSVPDEVLDSTFEAARWAASSYNEQPWRFLVAKTAADLQKFGTFLVEGNSWAKAAPVLVLTLAKTTFSHNGKPNRTASHDLGAASAYMTLAASQHGVFSHGMVGFDAELARATLAIPSDYEVVAMWALGYRGDTSQLPPDAQKREVPSGRRPSSEIVMEGGFHEVAPDETQQN